MGSVLGESGNLTGNKGEWSEAYTLLKLLAQRKLFAANEKLQKIEDMYYPIIKVIREDIPGEKREFKVDEGLKTVKIYVNDDYRGATSFEDFGKEADYLYEKIVEGGDRSFAVIHTEDFLKALGLKRIAAPAENKTDITLQLHDINTGYEPVSGFSIKSEIGSAPTLINASGATNFIYEVAGLSDEQIDSINAINTSTKILDRMNRIFTEANGIKFVRINSDTFRKNLLFIDSHMDEILSYALMYHYKDNCLTCNQVTEKLEDEDPMSFSHEGIYRYKFSEFLCCSALGMTPSKVWNGYDEANGGYIVVTKAGDVLTYYIYNRDSFKEYLINNTKFERASTTRHKYASLYKENGKTYLKLNLQIRFK